MFKNIARFAELYERLGMQFEILKGILWVEYNNMVIPVGPAKLSYLISEEEARFLLSRFPKALLIRYTDRLNNENYCEEGWYAVICDEFLDLNKLSKSTRRSIRKGLENCMVKMVNASFIAKKGYNVFISAFEKYKGVRKPGITEKEFKEKTLIEKDFDDIIRYWGTFHEGKLIAYSRHFIYDNIEVNCSITKFHPDFLRLYPSYAMRYLMHMHYLKDKSFEYINSGFRNVLHQTNIQEFLIKKFRYKKEYMKLNVVYRPYLSIYLSTTFPVRGVLSKISPKLAALYELEEIRRKCQNAE